MVKVSIIIVNWNTKELLRNCLASVFRFPPEEGYEVIVVDNASTDGSQEMVKKEFPSVRLVENSDNLGFSKANNQAIQLAKGKYVLLLNSDAEVLKGSIQALSAFLDEREGVAIVGCRLVNADGAPEESCGRIPSLLAVAATKLRRRGVRLRLIDKLASHALFNETTDVDWVTGACLMGRRDRLLQVGGFDENIFMYFEDIDLCYRVKKLGKVVFCPGAEVIHFRGGSATDTSDKIYRESQRHFFKKHFGFLQCLALEVLLGLRVKLAKKAANEAAKARSTIRAR